MAISVTYSTGGAVSFSTIEKSLAVAGGSTDLSTATDIGAYTLFLQSTTLVKGDQCTLRVYEKVSSTATRARIFSAVLSDAQSEAMTIPNLILGTGWDITIQMDTTTARTFDWSIRRVST